MTPRLDPLTPLPAVGWLTRRDGKTVLQQQYQTADGERVWVEVPTDYEAKETSDGR